VREPNPDPRCPHGTQVGYRRWRCGCVACREWNRLSQARYRRRRQRQRATPTAPVPVVVGDRVRHPRLGWGTVLATAEHGTLLTVRFSGTRRTTRQLHLGVLNRHVPWRQRPVFRRGGNAVPGPAGVRDRRRR